MSTASHEKFSQLLYEKLIASEKYPAKVMARRTGVPLGSLYRYCDGSYNPPAEFVAKIYNATGDKDFLHFIIDDTDQMLIDKQKGSAERPLMEEALDVAGACGRLMEEVQKAMKDKKLTKTEKFKIEKAINTSQKELEDLREGLRL